jgi:nucleotidyltransferase substrate binding protein (TIGR01987 family)
MMQAHNPLDMSNVIANDITDTRWKQRFSNFQAAFARLQEAAAANQSQPSQVLFQIALVKTFEMGFELSWKTLKDFLYFKGLDTKTPRDTIKQGFAYGILQDGQLWIDMLEDRNLMTHTYDPAHALLAITHIHDRYIAGMTQLHDYLLAQRDKRE